MAVRAPRMPRGWPPAFFALLIVFFCALVKYGNVGSFHFEIVLRDTRRSLTRTHATPTVEIEKPVKVERPRPPLKKKIPQNVVSGRPNILFLIADDMRPEIGAYAGEENPWINPMMKSPNLDQLASKSLLFNRAYCQQSWCNPSRASFLTSRRPDATGVYNNSIHFRENLPNVVTLPGFFRSKGYKTLGSGKVFHLLNHKGDHDDEYSWTEPMFRFNFDEVVSEKGPAVHPITDEERNGLLLQDELVTKQAKQYLRDVQPKALTGEQPFFIAVGMKKPHLPFVFPDTFMDDFPEENITLPFNPKMPVGAPEVAWAPSNEVSNKPEYKKYMQDWDFNKTFPDQVIRELRRGYYSSINYIDSLYGEILDELQELGLANNTIVTFIGDHGYHLGEQGIVGKNTNFEVANNSPMMIHVPGYTDMGRVTDELVEFVDLFPTLVELAGYSPIPTCPRNHRDHNIALCTEGSSLASLIEKKPISWKDRVFYQYPKYLGRGDQFCMGYSIRTYQYRYTEWTEFSFSNITDPQWDKQCAVELYDHIVDPHETLNVASYADMADIRQDLSEKLQLGWYAALPS